jgi:hypothetical protein
MDCQAISQTMEESEAVRVEIVEGSHAVVALGATAATDTEGARTQRAPAEGTAKRPSREHAKPRPQGRVLGQPLDQKIRGFSARP